MKQRRYHYEHKPEDMTLQIIACSREEADEVLDRTSKLRWEFLGMTPLDQPNATPNPYRHYD